MGHGERKIKLEIKVDPKKVLVSDLDFVTHAAEYPNEAEDWAQNYWESSITLEKYLAEPRQGMSTPEVIIPYDIDPSFIKTIPN